MRSEKFAFAETTFADQFTLPRSKTKQVMKGYLNIDDGSIDAEGFYHTG